VIGKALRSGDSTRGLVRYLFGPGEHNEHRAPRLVAGWDDLARIAPDLTAGDSALLRLARALDAPNAAAAGAEKSVYHLILSSDRGNAGKGQPADPALTDEQWGGIARDALRRIGVINRSDGDDVRWIAVRHDEPGLEHVHVVATLAGQQTGRRLHPSNDFYRIGEACRAAEAQYDLRRTAPRDRTSTPPVSRPERQKHERLGRVELPRDVLRRQVREAVSRATSTTEFLTELRGAGLLVKERLSPASGELTGYAVAVAGGDRNSQGEPIFYGGGRLASDLSLPKVRARYGEAPAARPAPAAGTGRPRAPGPAPRLTPEQRAQVWRHAAQAAEQAVRTIDSAGQDPAAAADAAWAASDYLTGAARLVAGNGQAGPLEAAARDLDRAAREQWGRVPPASAAGRGLRNASGLLLAARVVQHAETAQLLALLAQAAVLADAVTRLREAQGRAQQAAAARSAAEQLRALCDQRRLAGQPAQPTLAAVRGLDDDQALRHDDPTATGRGSTR